MLESLFSLISTLKHKSAICCKLSGHGWGRAGLRKGANGGDPEAYHYYHYHYYYTHGYYCCHYYYQYYYCYYHYHYHDYYYYYYYYHYYYYHHYYYYYWDRRVHRRRARSRHVHLLAADKWGQRYTTGPLQK